MQLRGLLVAGVATCGVLGCGLLGCGAGTPASELAKAPEFNPEGQTKCSVAASQSRPLIVEWPSTERGDLEAQARKGVVAVRYSGCEMQVLRGCTVPLRYEYTPFTRKDDQLSIHDADELYASVPIGAAKLEAKLERAGQLSVNMTVVGKLEAPAGAVDASSLTGNCDGVTHLVTGVTVGAFEFFAGAAAEVGAGVEVMGAGAGAKSIATRELLNRDGSRQACDAATTKDITPPEGCGAFLRLEVVPIATEALADRGEAPPAAERKAPTAKPVARKPLKPAAVTRLYDGGKWLSAVVKDGVLSLGSTSGFKRQQLRVRHPPSLTANRDGRVTALVVDSVGRGQRMTVRRGVIGNAWQPLPPGPKLAGRFVTIATSKDVLAAFVRDDNGRVQHIWQTKPGANSWSAWLDLGGQLAGDPVAYADASGRLHLFARSRSGELVHCAQSRAYGPWGKWTSLGAIEAAPAVVDRQGHHSVLAIHEGVLAERVDDRRGGWSDWQPVPTPGIDNPKQVLARAHTGAGLIVVQDGAGGFHFRSVSEPAWTAIPKRFAANASFAPGDDHHELAVFEPKGRLWVGAVTVSGFGGWREIPIR
jgi:hypothetical protein